MACVPADGCVGGISSWQGMVCTHWSIIDNAWLTDSDGVSGREVMDSGSERLAYCKKFFPTTTSIGLKTTAGAFIPSGIQWACQRSWSSYKCESATFHDTATPNGMWGFCQAGNTNCGWAGPSKDAWACIAPTA